MIETRQIDDLIVSIEVKPNRPGANFVAIRVIDTRRPALAPVTGVRLTVPGLAADARPSGEDEWQVAGLKIARAGALDLRVDVRRPGLPVSTTVRWTTGGAPLAAPPVVSRRRLGPYATPLALALLALAFAAAVGYRRRLRTAIVVAALLAIPSTAFAATDPAESVIVTLRGGPASVRPFAGTTSGRGAAVARALRQDLGRRGRGLRATLAGKATSIRPLWIAGGYAVTAPRSVVATLRSRPDVTGLGEGHGVRRARPLGDLGGRLGDHAAAGPGLPVDRGHPGQLVVLGGGDDPGHRLDGLDGVLPHARLAGEHHGVGAVEDRVRDVGGLRAGRPRVGDHRLEHLGRHDHRLGVAAGLVDHPLLQERHVLERALHPEVAAGHHERVERLDDLVEVVDRLRLLDLGDDRQHHAFLAHDRAHVVDVGGASARRTAR